MSNLVSSLPALDSKLLALLCLQYILSLFLPPTYAFLPIITVLLGNYLTGQLNRKPAQPTPTPQDFMKDVKRGRWTAQPYFNGNENEAEQKDQEPMGREGLVCFVLGSSVNQYG